MRFSVHTMRGPEIVRRRRRVLHLVRPVLEGLEIRSLLSGAGPYQPTADEQYMLALINQARANPAAFGQSLLAMAQSDPTIEAAVSNGGESLNQFIQVISNYGPEPPLAFNTGLIEAALDHDNAMLAANEQFHAPTGYLTNPQVATAGNGQAYYPVGSGGWDTGENIFAYSGNVPAGSGQQAYVDYFNAAFFLDWGNPDFGHLKNLLAPGPAEAASGTYPFSEIGIGLLTGVTPTTPPGANNPIAANQGLNVGPDIVTQEFGWRQGNASLTGVVYVDGDRNNFYTPGEGLGSVTIQAIGQGGQGTFQAQTWDSGGYSLSLPPGTYSVVAYGGGLSTPQSTTITIGQDNVPWNIQLPATSGGGGGGGGDGNADRPVPASYLSGGMTDLAVYRASTAQWFLFGQGQPITFGAANLDVPLPADYDGIGHAEVAVYRPSTAQWFVAGHAGAINFGAANLDLPVPGNYDGVGHAEVAVYRPSTAQWFIAGHAGAIPFGAANLDVPVPGDYDGVGHTEIAVYRPTTAQWFIAGHAAAINFGAPGDIPVPGDYDGVGHAEVAVYDPSTAEWFIGGHSRGISFGAPGLDIPVPGDYLGDGRTEIAVYRPSTAQWFILLPGGGVEVLQFGAGGNSTPTTGWLGSNALTPSSPLTQLSVAVASGTQDAGIGHGAGTNPTPRGPLALAPTSGRSRPTLKALGPARPSHRRWLGQELPRAYRRV
jgi:hypothetical protein